MDLPLLILYHRAKVQFPIYDDIKNENAFKQKRLNIRIIQHLFPTLKQLRKQ